MELRKINGNTYYIPGTTNIGVFAFKDKYTLLIDSGNNNQQARKISEMVEGSGMNIKYILNTHHHPDHSGGNIFFKEHYPGSVLYSSEKEKIYIEDDRLLPIYLYGASPIRELERHFVSTKKVLVDSSLETGYHKINNEKFEIISLPGHAQGQIGLATKDQVCFLGDGLFSEEIMEKYKFPFLFDIKEEFLTLETVENLDYDYYLLSHGEKIYNPSEIKNLVKMNQENIYKYLDLILELLQQPKTREEVFEEIAILEDLNLDFNQYYFSLSTTGAMITYLYDKGNLKYQIENGKLYYYQE